MQKPQLGSTVGPAGVWLRVSFDGSCPSPIHCCLLGSIAAGRRLARPARNPRPRISLEDALWWSSKSLQATPIEVSEAADGVPAEWRVLSKTDGDEAWGEEMSPGITHARHHVHVVIVGVTVELRVKWHYAQNDSNIARTMTTV